MKVYVVETAATWNKMFVYRNLQVLIELHLIL